MLFKNIASISNIGDITLLVKMLYYEFYGPTGRFCSKISTNNKGWPPQA
jgi:hypothetical protein